jgi:hypothetical protein
MKGYLATVLGVALVVALAWAAHAWLTSSRAPARGIQVALEDEASGASVVLLPLDGYQSGSSTTRRVSGVLYKTHEAYKVRAKPGGDFAVAAHYTIQREGTFLSVDRTLPVWSARPAKDKWSQVDVHLFACAYLSPLNPSLSK